MSSAVISASAAAANEIVAAVTGRKICVTGYILISSNTLNATWKSGSTALTGAFPLTAQVGIVAPLAPRSEGIRQRWFETAVGEALNLTLDAAHLVAGHVSYFVE